MTRRKENYNLIFIFLLIDWSVDGWIDELINCIYVLHRLISELNLLAAISAQEHASTKKQAAQNTSLSLVRQLFHMGVLEAAEPGQVQPKKTKTDEVSALCLSLVLVLVKGESIF